MKKQWKTGAAVVKMARKVVKEAGHSIKDCQLSIPEEGNTAKVFITITDGMKTQPDALNAMGGKLKQKAEEKGYILTKIEFMPILFTGNVVMNFTYKQPEGEVADDEEDEQTVPEIPITVKKQYLKDSTWRELAEAIRSGHAKEVLQLGDEIDITTKRGHAATVQVVHVKDNEVYFALKDAWEQMAMVDKISDGKLLSWAESNVRKHLQEKVLTDLPDDMAAVISKRTIKQKIGSDVKITEDKLWLLSHTEVFGRDDRAEADDADEFHFDFFDDERSRVKQRNGETDWWWLRTPHSGSSTYFRIVHNLGVAYSNNATYTSSVCFGFCIK